MNITGPIKRVTKEILRRFGVGILRYSDLENLRRDRVELKRNSSAAREIEFIRSLRDGNADLLLKIWDKSKSQLRQDLFVLHHLGFKRNGFFVEFGASNGVDLSNTYLMERDFGWDGILAEPAKIWHKDLINNRNCKINTDCIWKCSGSKIYYQQAATPELSTIKGFCDSDNHREARKNGTSYIVNTISLNDLLRTYDAPKNIDYLSIDTEGSEYEILSSWDFQEYTFEVITCEHNYTWQRDKIFSLLVGRGYKRVFESFSLFDDWYVRVD